MQPAINWTPADWATAAVWVLVALILLNDILPHFWFRRLFRLLFPPPPPKRKRRAPVRRKTTRRRR